MKPPPEIQLSIPLVPDPHLERRFDILQEAWLIEQPLQVTFDKPPHAISRYKILDVGAGTALWARYVAMKVKVADVYSIDRRFPKIREGHKRSLVDQIFPNHVPILGNFNHGTAFPMHPFDFIHASNVFPWVTDIRAFLTCCKDSLSPGGVVSLVSRLQKAKGHTELL